MLMFQIKVLSVKAPRWANKERNAINCIASFEHLKGDHPFTASPFDSEVHGREIYARCLMGEFGPIADAANTVSALPPCEAIQLTPAQVKLQAFLKYANLENSLRSPRSVVVVWGALLDQLLDELLEQARLSAPERPKKKPPTTFNGRINEAKKLGLIDQSDHDKCHLVREVRNAAAHQWDLTIDSPKVLSSLRDLYAADHSELFVFSEDFGFLIQQIYASSCALLAMRMLDSLNADSGPSLTASSK